VEGAGGGRHTGVIQEDEASAGSIVEQGVDHGHVDPGKLVTDTVGGTIGGVVGAPVGHVLGKTLGNGTINIGGGMSVATVGGPSLSAGGISVSVGTLRGGMLVGSVVITCRSGVLLTNVFMAAHEMAEEESREVSFQGRTKIGKFLEGEDVAEAAEHAKKVGKVTGVVDRAGATARRAERMKGRPTVPGMDRDEYPPAAIRPDDPSKVTVSPVNPSHNRRSGGRLRGELPPDGTMVEIDP
jgi:hypothetical protein